MKPYTKYTKEKVKKERGGVKNYKQMNSTIILLLFFTIIFQLNDASGHIHASLQYKSQT